MSLETQTKKINVIISLGGVDWQYNESLKTWCNSFCERYAYILHDKDFTEGGIKKTPHIHLVAQLQKRARLYKTLRDISEAVNVGVKAITIDKYTHWEKSLQYLIHRNDKDKYQYQESAIITNIDIVELDDILNNEFDTFDYDYLWRIAEDSENEMDFIRNIGITNYKNYWRVCDKIWLWSQNKKIRITKRLNPNDE